MHRGGVTKMLSCLVLLLSHVVAMPAARKTPPTGTQGPRCGVGLALFLSPRALSKRKSKTRGEGAATNHQNRSRATLKKVECVNVCRKAVGGMGLLDTLLYCMYVCVHEEVNGGWVCYTSHWLLWLLGSGRIHRACGHVPAGVTVHTPPTQRSTPQHTYP